MKEKLASYRDTLFYLLFVLSFVLLIVGLNKVSQILPSSAYEDKGVHTFMPYKVISTTKKTYVNHRRVERSVYKLKYLAADGSRYQATRNVASRNTGQQMINQKESLELRVFSIIDKHQYITVDPSYTIQSYVHRQSQIYYGIVAGSAIYLGMSILIWSIRRIRQQNH